MAKFADKQNVEFDKVSALVASKLDTKVAKVELVPQQGLINKTFFVDTAGGNFVVRTVDHPRGLEVFTKEKKVSDLIRNEQDYTPEILLVGEYQGGAFSIQQRISGVVGTEYDGDILEVWRQLGEYSKHFHSVEVPGVFSDMFSPKAVEPGWTQPYIDMIGNADDSPLIKKDVVTTQQFEVIIALIKDLGQIKFKPHIVHANIALPNTVVDSDGKAHIIDWGTGQGNMAPHRDVAELLNFNCTPEQFEAYMEGHDLDSEFLEDNRSVIKALRLARYATGAIWICNSKPDLLNLLPESTEGITQLLDE